MPAPEGAVVRRPAHPNVIVATLLFAAFVFSVVQTFVAPALPAVGAAYGSDVGTTVWVLTAFLLASSIATPLVGKLGDLYGRARVMIAILVIFAVGSAVAGMAESLDFVLLGRVIQGVGGGVFPLSFGILRETLEPRRVPGAIGLFSAMFGIGGALGLPLSGVVIEHLGVSYLFWIGVLALPAAVLVWRYVPRTMATRPGRIDWLGAVALSLALGSLLLGLSVSNRWGWTSAGVLAMIVGGVAGLVGWVLIEQRVREPLIEFRVLRYRPVLMANISGVLVGFAMFSSFLLVPQFLQTPASEGYGFGLTVTAAGLVILPAALVQIALSPFAGVLARRVSTRFPLLIGATALLASFSVLVVAHDRLIDFVIASAILGVGLALSMASMANVVVEAVPRHDVGVATGINQVSRTVGGALGTQVVTTLVTAQLAAGSTYPAERGYTIAFVVGGVSGVLALAAALAIPRRRGGRSDGLADGLAEVTVPEHVVARSG